MRHSTVVYFGHLLQSKNRLFQRELWQKLFASCWPQQPGDHITVQVFFFVAYPGVLRRHNKFRRRILNTGGFVHENCEALASVAVTLTP